MKFGLPWPLLRIHRRKVLSRDDCGVQESFHRVVKDHIYFVLRRNESIENRGVRKQRDGGSDDELLCRNKWRQRDDCTEVRRFYLKGNLLKRLPILYLLGGQRKEDRERSGTYGGCDQ